LFVVLESYLRKLAGWSAGAPDPSFAALKGSINSFQPSHARDQADGMLTVVYSRYNAASPPQFLFNRHGLLHGLRGSDDVDEMNCTRMFILFDILCSAEQLGRSIVFNQTFHLRHKAYAECRKRGIERQLIEGFEDA
jgi:hypothetical protein